MSWTLFPRIYTNLQSKVCFQFCFQVWRPVISTIVNPFMSFYEKSLPKYLIHENSKCQHLFTSEKTVPKRTNFSTFCLIFKGHHFSITKLDILIFCNILHLEIDFWNLSSKRIVSLWTFWQKCREKHYKWDIEKNGIAYSTARNLKTAYLWNFQFH